MSLIYVDTPKIDNSTSVKRFRSFYSFLFCLWMTIGFSVVAPAYALAATNETDLLFGTPASERDMSAQNVPSIEANYAAVIDQNGTSCFERMATEQAQIASLTKIMTAIVVLETLDPSVSITVTPTAASVGESSAGLLQGDTMSFDDALKALLTASGNDAAVALAETAGANILANQGIAAEGSACEAAFVQAMNTKASDLGLVNSYFTNPHGLDFDSYAAGQYSCAQDVAVMLRYGMGIERFRANIGFTQTDITVTRAGESATLSLSNTDTMLGNYPGTIAAKTGYTLAAGPCVATAVNRDDGHEYYAVVLGSSSKPQRFADSEALYNWTYINRDTLQAPSVDVTAKSGVTPQEQETVFQLIAAPRSMQASIGGVAGTYPVVAEVAHNDWPNRTFTATAAQSNKTASTLESAGRIEQHATFSSVTGRVCAGDVVGHLTFQQGDSVLWETDLIAAEDVAAPTWWEGIGVWFERLIGSATGAAPTAESKLLNPGPLRVS